MRVVDPAEPPHPLWRSMSGWAQWFLSSYSTYLSTRSGNFVIIYLWQRRLPVFIATPDF